MRLGEDEALGLGLGGEEEQIRRLIERRQALAGLAAHEPDPIGRRARRRAAAQRLGVAPLPDEEQLGVGQSPRDQGERLDHALHALLAVEAPDVEADEPVGAPGPPRPGPPRGRRGGRARGARPWAPRRWAPRTPRARRVSAMALDGATTRSAAVGEAARQPHGEGGDQPLGQRDVVRVLLVARVIREDERNAEPPREPPARHPEEERVLDVDDVGPKPPGQAREARRARARAPRSPGRSARESRGSGRRRADQRRRARRGRRSRPDARRAASPARSVSTAVVTPPRNGR